MKRIASIRRLSEHGSPVWYDDHVSFMPEMDSPKQHSHPSLPYNYPNYTSCKKEMDLQYGIPPDHFLQLPLLESPKMLQPQTSMSCNPLPTSYGPAGLNLNPGSNFLSQDIHQTIDHNFHSMFRNSSDQQSGDQVTDWRVLDKFVASQLSQEETSKGNDAFPGNDESNLIARNLINKQEMAPENASTSSSSCQIDLWK
ncbi:NAC domain-containing protein 7 [Sesamum angolense]|uniref:NAC domain-containing protein 7 n=1 Tax=Sesamum angolense TaxID=2727404 RepID=A0AAE1W1Q2_9LAMI|nr:NAC domain-containing protein 7 [Sesamum angolense]